jgi:predicted RNase H-like HicB family nuclease
LENLTTSAKVKSISNSHIRSNAMKFSVVVEKDEGGGYIVSCPAIKGCHSQGETVEEALKNIKEAITGCLQTLNERARKVAQRRGPSRVTVHEIRVA